MTVRKYHVIKAMDATELQERVNFAIEQYDGTLIGGVAARGAQLLQAMILNTYAPDPEPEKEENAPKSTAVEAETPVQTTAAPKKKGTKKQ